MLNVGFYESTADVFLQYVVIASRYQNKWVFCKHKQRDTFEMPGGHIEAGESSLAAAKRELFEETGAVQFEMKPICVYSVQGRNAVIDNEKATFGMLYFAEITAFEKLPDFEMERIELFNTLPTSLTYPTIHPKLMEKVKSAVHSA